MQRLRTGQSDLENKFPVISDYLLKSLNAAQILATYSGANTESQINELALNLKEQISLLETAEQEYADHQESLNESKTTIQKTITDAQTSFEQINELHTEANELVETSKRHLTETIAKQENILNETEQLKQTVRDLLPGATSAGLASSFSDRARKLNMPRLIWGVSFIATLSVLGYFSFHAISFMDTAKYWTFLLERAPLSVPFIWLGWFSAIQYLNSTKLQEDYEFKTAASKAFVGYKDHMEFMSTINSNNDPSVNVMNNLANKTVDILATEPGRLLGKSHEDALPSNIINRIIKVFARKMPAGLGKEFEIKVNGTNASVTYKDSKNDA